MCKFHAQNLLQRLPNELLFIEFSNLECAKSSISFFNFKIFQCNNNSTYKAYHIISQTFFYFHMCQQRVCGYSENYFIDRFTKLTSIVRGVATTKFILINSLHHVTLVGSISFPQVHDMYTKQYWTLSTPLTGRTRIFAHTHKHLFQFYRTLLLV